VTFPGRSILRLEACGGKCGAAGCTAVLVDCDCGTSTHLAVEVQGSPGTAEAAFTCDGCATVTWFTVTSAAS
jgi:hypothetical protein